MSQADSEVGESSNRMRHDGDLTLGSTIQNIDDEIRLCRQLFAREREVTLHDCEAIHSESGQYDSGITVQGIARLMMAAFVVGTHMSPSHSVSDLLSGSNYVLRRSLTSDHQNDGTD
jgi:hypothetical protein